MYGIGRIERMMYSNWFNPFATLWLNLRSFPLSQSIRFPVWVYGRPKLRCLSGSMKVVGKVESGMVVFNQVRMMAPNLMTLQTEIVNQGTIEFHGPGIIGTGNKIVTYFGSILKLGSQFMIQDQVNIGCMKYISIGELSWITHRCQIFDSNYHYIVNLESHSIHNHTHPILIGNHCWIGNTSTITGGAEIPDYTIVASNSLVNKSINSVPEASIIGGIPAKLISSGYVRLYNSTIEKKCREYFKNITSEPFFMDKSATINDLTN